MLIYTPLTETMMEEQSKINETKNLLSKDVKILQKYYNWLSNAHVVCAFLVIVAIFSFFFMDSKDVTDLTFAVVLTAISTFLIYMTDVKIRKLDADYESYADIANTDNFLDYLPSCLEKVIEGYIYIFVSGIFVANSALSLGMAILC